MKQDLYEKFIGKINEYKSSLNQVDDETAINVADEIAEWVENNSEALDCECLDDIFDEYADMRYYVNDGYKEDMFPNGMEEDEDFEDMLIDDEFNEERECIESIRDYCCEDEDYDFFADEDDNADQDEDFDEDDELERCCLEEEEDSTENEEIFDYITRHALVTLGMLEDVDDPAYDTMLEKFYFFHILAGLVDGESDELIAAKAMAPIVMRGYMIDQENLKELVRATRAKCKMHVFVLNMTGAWLYSQNQDPADVLVQVMQMLG